MTRKFKMRKLIDKWTPIVFILFCLVKVLQTVKNWWGVYPKHSGWRSAMNAFSRTEHSKFTLAAFHLDVFSDLPSSDESKSFEVASTHLIERLRTFLKTTPESQWQLVWQKVHAFRKKKKALDVIEAHFSVEGNLLSIQPHFDSEEPVSQNLSEDSQKKINQKVVDFYNLVRTVDDKKRPWALMLKIKKWTLSEKHIKPKEILAALHYVDRILSGAFIHFDQLPGPELPPLHSRFVDPPFIRMKHPGHGLLNIHCRFTADFSEADLWFQFHHVPVDGVPMQEMLNGLKQSWGTCSDLKFPSLDNDGIVVSQLCSTEKERNAIYQAKRFVDFRPFLKVRKELNAEHGAGLGSSITAVGMLLWGLSHHESLRGRKFMFTVEMPEKEGRHPERSPGLVIIRPSLYFDAKDPRAGFIRFQRLLAERIEATRERRSETHELMESYALTTPLIYKLIQKLFPKSFSEFVGTVGITMIRDSDHFTAPVSDINTDGFLAFGNFSVPTECGGSAGVVTVRGSQKQVHDYLSAVSDVAADFYKYC